MPKVVDHEQRRAHIVDVTWNLIVAGGVDAVTMREIAREAGFANGALKHYFPSKDVIIMATYQRALAMMQRKIAAAVGDLRGLEALRVSCRESMPIDDERVTAGRVLLAFWAMSLSHPQLAEAYQQHLVSWREALRESIAQGRADGDIVTQTPDEQLVDEVVLMNAGANVMMLFGPGHTTYELLRAHVDAFLDRLTKPLAEARPARG
jgi:AcrR family transcriptional regulator